MLLKQQEEESRRKELEETRKCEEEVAKRRMLNQARADLEIKHFEEKQGMCFCCQPSSYYCERLVLFTKYMLRSTVHPIPATRKLLSDRASEELKKRAMRECEIFERDVRLQQEREKGKADAAKRKVEQERVAIDESRRQQLQRQSQEKEADKKLGELYVKELARITAQQQDSEHKKKAAKRKQHSDLRKMQEQQIRENERRRAREKAEALKEEHQVRFGISVLTVRINILR